MTSTFTDGAVAERGGNPAKQGSEWKTPQHVETMSPDHHITHDSGDKRRNTSKTDTYLGSVRGREHSPARIGLPYYISSVLAAVST